MSVAIDKQAHAAAPRGQERVWDIAVRAFHWSLVVTFFIAYFTEDDLLWLHVWAGYAVGGLVLFRILWGLVGTRHARFSDFIYGPAKGIAYLRDLARFKSKRYLGHSPAGAMMVFALLAVLAAVVGTGLQLYAIEDHAGPLAVFVQSAIPQRGGVWEEAHELLANLAIVLVGLHILGVVLASVAHHENLARAMVTGVKERRPGDVG